MKRIPLKRKDNSLYINARINNAFSTDFVLDTGCSSTVLSKEISDILFLYGKLTDKDITGTETSNWGSHCVTRVNTVLIKKLSFGKYSVHNVKASLCKRYGAPTLLGMSCLDKMKDYLITADSLLIPDDKDDEAVVENRHVRKVTDYIRHCQYRLKRLRKEREKHPEANYMFDYKNWCIFIFDLVNSCFRPLCDKDKYNKVIAILEELRTLMPKNLDYDQEHPSEHGAFITGYFNYYLATAYFQADRRQEALDYYEKAKAFFLDGTPTRQEIDDNMGKVEAKIRKDGLEEKHEPKLVPMRTMDLDGDVRLLRLKTIEVIDNIYGSGEKRTVYTGFKDFKSAFDFSVTYHKRLEIIKCVGGIWYRTDMLPIEDLSAYDLDMGDTYMCCCSTYEIENKAKELIEDLNGSNPELAEVITSNKTQAMEKLKAIQGKFRWKYNVILNKEDLSLDGAISPGSSLQWHDIDLAICVIEVDDSIAKKLVDDVLSGKFIPCAIGQMPEDFLFLFEKYGYFKTCNDEGYTGNNNSNCAKWIVNNFVVMDDENSVGYSYRETYDNIHWRWAGGEHSNQGGIPKTCEDINSNVDYKFCYWQLIRKTDSESSSIISCKPC